MTVFTGVPRTPLVTDWDQRCGFEDSSAAMAARIEEDREAFAGLDVERWGVGLIDEGYRGAEAPDRGDLLPNRCASGSPRAVTRSSPCRWARASI